MKIHDLIGQKFGNLLVLSKHPENYKNKESQWICKCDCGNEIIIRGWNLASGYRTTCGCHWQGIVKKYGLIGHRANCKLSQTWYSMHKRCLDTGNASWKYYGGRGIKVCEEWKDFEVFKKWALSSNYQSKLQIDRIDNDGNYEPNNCRWITIRENCHNRRSSLNRDLPVGVSKMKNGKYRAYINVGKQQIHLGLFINSIDAHQAYLRKLIELNS